MPWTPRKARTIAKRITINKPMMDALKRLMRLDACPICGQEISYHSHMTFKADGSVAACSNEEGKS